MGKLLALYIMVTEEQSQEVHGKYPGYIHCNIEVRDVPQITIPSTDECFGVSIDYYTI
jgi:hypothetical protein